MELVSNRVKVLAESATIAMNQKSNDLKAKGVKVINLTVGEPDFFTPDNVKQAAKKAIDDNYSFYTAVPGYPELLTAIAAKLKRENNLEYTPAQISVANGAKHNIANIILAIVNAGDEVIVPAPYWVSYPEQVKLAEGINVILETSIDNNYKITPAQLEKAISPKTKAIILCSPSNPTGAFYSKTELEALAVVLRKYPHVFIISDEIYEHINYSGGHHSIASCEGMYDRTAVVNGVSKGYAMTGYRIGYMAAPLWLTKACNKLQGQMTTGASSIAQRAAIEALNGDQSSVKEFQKAFERRAKLFFDGMSSIPGIKCNKPEGAFYVFPDVSSYFGKSDGTSTINNSDDLCLYLLDKAHVVGVAGSGFGHDKCIRFSFATSDENLKEALNLIKEALALLK